jgi:hypothetical protein
MTSPTAVTIASDVISISCSDYSSQKETLCKGRFEENSQLTTIEAEAFARFKSLSFFSLENCNLIREIPSNCFLDCSSLKTVILPKDGILETLNGSSFSGTNITSLKLPPSVKNILKGSDKRGAFSYAKEFQKFEFYSRNGLETVNEYAFFFTSLIEFDVGPNLNSISAVAFENIGSSFVRFTSSGSNENFCVIDNILYSGNNKTLICCPHGYIPKSICSSVLKIGNEAFHSSIVKHFNFLHNGITKFISYSFSLANMETIDIPETVTAIDGSSFLFCRNLRSIILPPIRVIYESTFSECIKLRTIVIMNGTNQINNNAFYNCKSVRDIYIPSSVTQVSTSAFNLSSIGRCGVHCPFDKRSDILTWNGFTDSSFDRCFELKTFKSNCRSSPVPIIHFFILIHS